MRALAIETDERLLIEAAQRDPSRFGVLYDAYVDRVYAYIARRVPNRQEAEDLTAEVFHQALANIKRFEWRGVPFIAWLMRIAANALADRWSRMARQQEVPSDDLELEGAHAETERRAILGQVINTLPADQRTVIVRRFIEERSIREIALELQRSEGAVKQLQVRALQNLRDKMRTSHG